ncbi:MAG: hypothetical protein OHK0035_28980 [Cyanobacteria bacterium J069]
MGTGLVAGSGVWAIAMDITNGITRATSKEASPKRRGDLIRDNGNVIGGTVLIRHSLKGDQLA